VSGRARLAALALVSAASLGFEIALTRYFAVAKWSEYGYWVISIVLAGFALSGVVLALARDWFARRGAAILPALVPAMLVAMALGYHATTANPFNPLLLQNQATLWPQLGLIGLYHLELLPFFFLAGLFVSLCFVLDGGRVGLVYGCDLAGAGAGALFVLLLMLLVPPFRLVAWLMLPLAAAALAAPRHWAMLLASLLLLGGGEALLLARDSARFNDFKAIYAPLHVPDSRTLATVLSPSGLYMLLDDFTERVDQDVSNDAAQLGVPGPPLAFGLYRDGNRIAALPKPGGLDVAYAPATLAALPYTLLQTPRVLLIGASGGFRAAEVHALGAARVTALEPEPELYRALRQGLGRAPRLPPIPGVTLRDTDPLAAARTARGRYDLVDVSSDYLDAAPANATEFTVEDLRADLAALAPGGLLSVPVSIREFPSYASRVLATVRAALLGAGVRDPPAHVLLYRSAWNVRILASPAPLPAALVATARKWCDDRSFDVSYFPGIDVIAARAGIYNDLPAVSFANGTVTSGDSAHDAVADEAGAILAGRHVESETSFDLSPITLDRPAFYALLRLSRWRDIVRRLELLPQAEVAPVVNLAVLAQAALIAALVLAVPLLARRGLRRASGTPRAAAYFAALGLGFLFIEIFAIEWASVYLDDRTAGFAVVLTVMLVCSGVGALLAGRVRRRRRAQAIAAALIMLWAALLLAALRPALLGSLGWPHALRLALVAAVVAPASVALGMPFPLGLAQIEREAGGAFLPWAWALNGAFSVVATPLANLIAQQAGFSRVLLLALFLYGIAALCFPNPRGYLWPARHS
jgi:spermidine synthase